MKTRILFFVVAALCVLAVSAWGQFTAGNLVVLRVGDGSGALTNASTAVFLDEYTTAGSSVGSTAMPTVASGGNAPFANSGSATSEGNMTRSADGRYLVLAGYGAVPGVSGIASTTSATYNRVVARVDATGDADVTTMLSDAYSANNIRGACSVDGTAFWTSGTAATGGSVRYATLGGTTSTQLSTTITNIRVVNVFDNQLYVTSATGTFQGVSSVGGGTPTTSGQTITLLSGFPTASGPSPYAFSVSPDGNTIYVADDRTNGSGGVQKWTLSGTWTLAYTHTASATTGCRGLTVDWSGTNPVIYATSTDNKIQSVTDAGSAGTLTTIATGATNTAIRGIAFSPYASITFSDGSSYAPSAGTPGTSDNPVGRFQLKGNINGSQINEVVVTLTGTYSGITNLKLYYCTSSTFSTSTLLSTVASPTSPVTFTISSPQAITTSDGYFFVAADLDGAATGSITASLADQTKFTFSNAYIANFSNVNLSASAVALPVEMTSFTAVAQKMSAMLVWSTATEVNNYGYEIERRAIASNAWAKVGFVAGNGTTNSTHEYSYIDDNLSAGKYAYRIKQIDNSGAFKYSNSTELEIGVPASFALNQNYPNPFNPTTHFTYEVARPEFVSVKIYDVLGREAATLVNEVKQAGSYILNWNAASFDSGIYFCRMQSGSFVATKKIVLMK